MKKVLVALSGGVDSAVAAMLLKERGYDVQGAYMKTWMNEEGSDLFADCPWEEDIEYATAVAKHLDIPFKVVNFIEEYRERVVQYLVEGYRRGITPNPDLMCNREMKFGVFLDYALSSGFDCVATGHYARRHVRADGSSDILEGLDPNKDQSYFLALVRQEQLSRALFPIGEFEKPEVRKLAQEGGLPNAKRKDSQGICFLGKVDINKFLAQYIDELPGNIVDEAGEVRGRHSGLHNYTLGQRKGIGVPSNADNENFIVTRKDYERNELVIAFESSHPSSIFTFEAELRDISYVNEPLEAPKELLGKVRYRDPAVALQFTPDGEGGGHVRFKEEQRALAKGQLLALYAGDRLIGGGFYC